jgi:polysaccharide biosynthesis protein PslJ
VTGSLRIEWRWLVGLLLVVVLFIPPRRYAVPAGLPFELDPYRLFVAGLLVVWLLSALSDQGLTLRRSGLVGPLLLFGLAVLGSLAANPDRVSAYQTNVVKLLSVLAGYILVFYVLVNILRTRVACETALAVLVVGGAILAVLAIVERKTGWSPFIDLDGYLPFLQPAGVSVEPGQPELVADWRGARALGSAEHPIALGALLAMLAPVAAALAVVRRQAVWVVCLMLIVVGSFATVSRTPVLMLFAWALMFTALRWTDAKRFIPFALVAFAMIHFVMPGALGTLRSSLDPALVIEEQSSRPDSQIAAGRIADLGPSFEEFRQRPVFGYGFGTRITVGEQANARLLDNQWLGTLLDTGLLGVLGLAWLFGRYIVRTSVASLKSGPDGVVLAALASAVFAYGVGMFTFDALAFTQVTLVLFVLLAIGSALVLAAHPVMEVFERRRPAATPQPYAPLRPVDEAT